MSTLDPIIRTISAVDHHRMGLAADPVRRSVGPQQAVLAAERLAGAGALARGVEARDVVGVHASASIAGDRHGDLRGRQAAQRRRAGRIGDGPGGHVDVPQADAAGFLGQRETRRGVRQVLQAALLVVDVHDRAADEHEPVADLLHVTPLPPPPVGPIGIAKPVLGLEVGAVTHGRLKRPLRLGPVVGVDRRRELLAGLHHRHRRQPVEARRARRQVHHVGGRIELPDAESRRLLGQRQPRRRVGQRLHAFPLLVDVDDGAGHEHGHAVDLRHAILLAPPPVRCRRDTACGTRPDTRRRRAARPRTRAGRPADRRDG